MAQTVRVVRVVFPFWHDRGYGKMEWYECHFSLQAWTLLVPRRVKKLMRPRTCSISGAPQAVRDTGSGLDTLHLR
jgi:hypothetical protein